MSKRYFLTTFLSFIYLFVLSQDKKISRQEYISTYADIAVKEMKRTGIPASITLSQGMLESGNGNSTLAVKGNNHFGIKCHSSWKGKKIYHDDDKKHECFRKYKSALDSYKDHSEFLTTHTRYAFLLELKTTDYKGWAKGLRKAGYATDPKYATRLINVIESNKLYTYDSGAKPTKPRTLANRHRRSSTRLADIDNFTINYQGRKVFEINRVKYIIIKKGDTFYSIANEFDLLLGELYRFNDLSKNAVLVENQTLYIQPKRCKAFKASNYHVVRQGETMYSISQKHAMRLKCLYRKNNMKIGYKATLNQKLWLRKRKPEADY